MALSLASVKQDKPSPQRLPRAAGAAVLGSKPAQMLDFGGCISEFCHLAKAVEELDHSRIKKKKNSGTEFKTKKITKMKIETEPQKQSVSSEGERKEISAIAICLSVYFRILEH